jgi:ATP-dependent DNA helicase DinG
VEQRLAVLTGRDAEARPAQRAYAREAAGMFAPRPPRGGASRTCCWRKPGPAPARPSAISPPPRYGRRNRAAPSGFRPIPRRCNGSCGAKAGAFPAERHGKAPVVVRKGRENYLCLLNLEDALQGGFAGAPAILAQLVARWAAYSQDGDMIGGDLPGWLGTLFRKRGISALTDQRGECVYAGCPHYRKCFIERAVRASADAELVIANHALVMVNAARRDAAQRPTRIVFDEGHHVFEAADSTFSAADRRGGDRAAPLGDRPRRQIARAAARAFRAAGRRGEL